jgi:hypothetical protein
MTVKKILIIALLGMLHADATYSVFEPVQDCINSGVQATQKCVNTLFAMLFRSKKERDTLLRQLEQKFDHKPVCSNDISLQQAHRIMNEYRSWATRNNTLHKQLTDEIRFKYGNCLMYASLKPYEKDGYIYFIFMKYWKSYLEKEMQDRWNEDCDYYKERACTSFEKDAIKCILQDFGYSATKALEISEKIYVLKSADSMGGYYVPSIDRIFLKKYIVQDVVHYYHFLRYKHLSSGDNWCVYSIHTLLHEVEHYNYFMGHLQLRFPDYVREEQRADLEALAKIQNVMTIDVSELFGNSYCSISSLKKGYLCASPLVRNCLLYEVQKQKIEAQFM